MLTLRFGESKPLVIADCQLPFANLYEHLGWGFQGQPVGFQ